MFQFPPCPPTGLYIQPVVPGYCPGGFPHSGISGSKLDDSSPKLIAAIHALHRLLAPRHPPHALSSLIHARRQYLMRLHYSAQLLRYHQTCWLAALLAGATESDSVPPVSHAIIQFVRHKIARLITGRNSPDEQHLVHYWIRATTNKPNKYSSQIPSIGTRWA